MTGTHALVLVAMIPLLACKRTDSTSTASESQLRPEEDRALRAAMKLVHRCVMTHATVQQAAEIKLHISHENKVERVELTPDGLSTGPLADCVRPLLEGLTMTMTGAPTTHTITLKWKDNRAGTGFR